MQDSFFAVTKDDTTIPEDWHASPTSQLRDVTMSLSDATAYENLQASTITSSSSRYSLAAPNPFRRLPRRRASP